MAELMVLLIVIAIVAFAILPSVLARMRQSARATTSKNNLSMMGKAIRNYEGLGNGNLPPVKWEEKLAPFIDGPKKVMACPLRFPPGKRNGGGYSYALYTGSEKFAAGDAAKIAIVTSDHRLIEIDTKKCEEGKPVIKGELVARDRNLAFALMYGGAVRAFTLDEIAPDDNENIVTWWLPFRERNIVCGKVIKVGRAVE